MAVNAGHNKHPLSSHGLFASRNNSVSSIQSEPTWDTRRHQSEPHISMTPTYRKESNASQISVTSTASHKKSGFKGLFSHKDKEKKKEPQKIVLGSKYAVAVKTKMMLDPTLKEFQKKHPHENVRTANVNERHVGVMSQAAEQEARHPHSGPAALHGSMGLAMLTRIESHDEPDDEIDEWEAQRRAWNEAKEHNLEYIPEQYPSAPPDVLVAAIDPALGIDLPEKSSYTTSSAVPVVSDLQADALAKALNERLETTA